MSDVIRKIDPKAATVLAGVDDRGRSGSSLLAPEDLEEQLLAVLKWMRGPRQIQVEGLGSESVPRFGLISLIAQQTPFYVYGHPALKEISKTAFTDGIHVFISDDLFDKLNDNVDDNPSTFGIEWVLMHELMHKLFNHNRRLRRFPHDIANQATDLSINTKLEEGFPDLPACPLLKETGLGFKPGDKDRWIHLSEETIAMELMAQRGMKKDRKVEADSQQDQPGQQGKKGQPQQGQGGQQGQPQPGQGGQPGPQGQGGQKPGPQGKGKGTKQGQGGSGGQQQDDGSDPLSDIDDPSGSGSQDGADPGAGNQQDQPGGKGRGDQHDDQQAGGGGPGGDQDQDESDEPSDAWGDGDDTHFIDPADLIKVLEENGLEAVKDKLELPDSDDVEAIGEMQEAARLKQAEAIMQAQAQMARIGGKYPGAHIVDAAGEMVKDFGKAKITWRLALQELVLGASHHSAPSMEEPNDLLYVDGIDEVLGFRPYLQSSIPHKSEDVVLFLVDTSGSMSNEAMNMAVTEALELKTAAQNMGDAAAEVLLWSCDTVLRGKPLEITDANVEEVLAQGVEMKGRGGTSIDTCINQAMRHQLLADKKIKSIIYCSDLYDNPVPRPESLEDHPDLRVLFLGDPKTPASSVETFAKGTNWADVFVIEDGLEIDFEQLGEQAVSPTIRKRRPR